MNSLTTLLRGPRAAFMAGVISLFYFLFIGFRGFAPSGLAWRDGSLDRARELLESPLSFLKWAVEPQIMSEFIGALAILSTPLSSEWTLVGLALIAATISGGLIFVAGHRLAGTLGGWLSLFFILTSAPWMGLFTRADPTSLLMPVLLGVVLIWHSRLSWWKRTLFGAPILAIAFLLWPGAILLPLVLLIVDLLAPIVARSSDQRGLFSAPSLSLDRLLTPVLALLLLALSPFFWPAPSESFGAYFTTLLEMPPADLVFRGTVYPPSRPPFYFGLARFAEQIPFLTAIAMGCGVVLCRQTEHPQRRRFSISLAAICVGLLLFPVFLRDPRPLGAEFEILVMATASPLAAMITARFFLFAMGSNSPSMKIRQVAIGAFLLAGGSILLELAPSMDYPEAYRSSLTARLVGWSPESDMPHRQEMLPLTVLRSSASEPGQVLHTGGWEKNLEAYRSMGLLQGIETTPDPDLATVSIRLVPPVAANRFVSFTASYPPPLPDTKTRPLPGLHRPLFFIDERLEPVAP